MASKREIEEMTDEFEHVVFDENDYISDDEKDPQLKIVEERPSPWRTGKYNASSIVNNEAQLRQTVYMQNCAATKREQKFLALDSNIPSKKKFNPKHKPEIDLAFKKKVLDILHSHGPEYDLTKLYIHDISGNYVLVRVRPKYSLKISGGIPYIYRYEPVNPFNGAIVDVSDPSFFLPDHIRSYTRGYADSVIYENENVTVVNGNEGTVFKTTGASFTRYDDSPIVRVWKRNGEINFSTSFSINGKKEELNPQWQMFTTNIAKEFEPYEVGISSLFDNVESGCIHFLLRTKNLCSDHNNVEYGPVLLASDLPQTSMVNFGLFLEQSSVDPEKFKNVFSQDSIFLNNEKYSEIPYDSVSISLCNMASTILRTYAHIYRSRVLPVNVSFNARMFELSNVRFLTPEEYRQRWYVLLKSVETPEDRIKNLIEIVYKICPACCMEDVSHFYEKYFGEMGIVKKLPDFIYDRYMNSTTGSLKLDNYEKDIINRSRTYNTGDMYTNIRLTFESNDPSTAHVDGNELYKVVKKYTAIQKMIAKHASRD